MLVYNVRKLDRPRMLDAFLADSVNTALAIVYNSVELNNGCGVQ